MKVDPFEFSADQKEELKKSKKKLLTKEKIIGIDRFAHTLVIDSIPPMLFDI